MQVDINKTLIKLLNKDFPPKKMMELGWMKLSLAPHMSIEDVDVYMYYIIIYIYIHRKIIPCILCFCRDVGRHSVRIQLAFNKDLLQLNIWLFHLKLLESQPFSHVVLWFFVSFHSFRVIFGPGNWPNNLGGLGKSQVLAPRGQRTMPSKSSS